jgi:hypothetical protein
MLVMTLWNVEHATTHAILTGRKKSARLSLFYPQHAGRPMSRPELCHESLCMVDSPDTPALRLAILSAWKKEDTKAARPPRLAALSSPCLFFTKHTPESRSAQSTHLGVDHT